MVANASRRTRFGEDRTQLPAFVQQPLALQPVAKRSLGGDLDPQLGFVGLLEHDAKARCELGVGTGAARASVIASDTKS
jgi:hypothetical protein